MSFVKFDSVPHKPLSNFRELWGTLSKNKRAASNHLATCGSFEKRGGMRRLFFLVLTYKRKAGYQSVCLLHTFKPFKISSNAISRKIVYLGKNVFRFSFCPKNLQVSPS